MLINHSTVTVQNNSVLRLDFWMQVLRRSTQEVWASPSHRRMDSKSESEEMTYPFVCFTVDNFDEAFSDIQVFAAWGPAPSRKTFIAL